MEIKKEEWTAFAEFIARQSTWDISQYIEDGTYTCCPFSTMGRAYAAFSVWRTCHSQSEVRKFYDVDYVKANPDYDEYVDDPDYVGNPDYEDYEEEPDPFYSHDAAFAELEDKYWNYLYPCAGISWEEAYDKMEAIYAAKYFREYSEEINYDTFLEEQESPVEKQAIDEWLTHEGENYQIFEEIRKCEEAKLLKQIEESDRFWGSHKELVSFLEGA